MHLGHRAILRTVVGRARDLDGEAVVYTFDPHPRKILRPDTAPRLLTTLEQKIELLEQAGIDVLINAQKGSTFASGIGEGTDLLREAGEDIVNFFLSIFGADEVAVQFYGE